MSVQFHKYYKNDATYDISQPEGIAGLIEWIVENEDQVIISLDICAESDVYPPPFRHGLSICQLYYVLHLLPSLTSLSVYNVVLSPCDIVNHAHLSLPQCIDLKILALSYIACRFPFDINPLSVIQVAPHLSQLELEVCPALPRPRGHRSSSISARHPQMQLPAVGSCPSPLRRFKVTFPDAYERSLWRVSPSWYDSTTLLPTNRRTQELQLHMIDCAAVAAASAIIMEDAGTIDTLWMEFQPLFQVCPADAWGNLSFAGCSTLRTVTLRIPVMKIIDPDVQMPYDALRELISKLPANLAQIRLDFVLEDVGEGFRMLALEAIPWSKIDDELEAAQSTALVVVYFMGLWAWCQADRTRALVETGLSRTLASRRLLLEPTELWDEWKSGVTV